VSLADVRRLAVRAQLLDGQSDLPAGKEGVARAIEQLGYVQIDTISVVARAHHQTLWARRSDYRPAMLHDLLAVDRRVFEYWGHAASVLPMSDFRYYLPKMRRSPTSVYGKSWLAENAETVRHVVDRIRAEGALASKDFERPKGEKAGAWWDWKPAKMALEILFSQGELMVAERRNFQRVYDLTERVLPETVDLRVPPDSEVNRFFVLRALDAYGVATEREMRFHILGPSAGDISTAVEELGEDGLIRRVAVEGADGQAFYLREGQPAQVRSDAPPPRCRLLCPFDNLIIQRDRTQWLFGFDYTLECYLPEAKRRYGYFIFPILFGDRLVGRLDPKADRRAKVLIAKTLTLEVDVDGADGLLPALAEALARFAQFNGCREIAFETVRPTGLKRGLKSLVRRALSGGG